MKHKRYHGEPEEVMQDYFFWLCDYIGANGEEVIGQEKPYICLMEFLHNKTFVAFVHYDENRISDGEVLRKDFKETSLYLPEDYECLDRPCTVLEVLVALARKMDDILNWDTSKDQTPLYFWEFIQNLGLDRADDDVFYMPTNLIYVEEIIDQFVRRKYASDGRGGLFPLKHAKEDQREVEIWYQMAAYIQENYPI